MRLWRRLDPRLHLAAANGWAVFLVVTLAALVTASLAAGEAETRARADTERLLAQFAVQIRQQLMTNLETRRSIVQATAAQIVASADRGNEALRRHLEAVQLQFPEFSWLGVADDRGRVIAAGHGLLEGSSVSDQVWFRQGHEQAFLSEAWGPPPAGATAPGEPGLPRGVELALPLTQIQGRNVGVLGARLSWAWIERQQGDLLKSLDAGQQFELLVTSDDGRVLVGPSAWLGTRLQADADLTAGGAFIVGRRAQRPAGDLGLGWTVVVRQAAASALAPARATRQTVFFTVLLAGLVAALAAVAMTRILTRHLGQLAVQAEAVRSGAQRSLVVPPGRDEVSSIGATLAEVVDKLQQEKQALQKLNIELDARVVERTARIERLADDARMAAVTRERLRLARGLHDTLAHSLMALLTQIRLVRKLRPRWTSAELEAELARAEDVAATGLAEARSAITQMRSNNVGEVGLGPSLQDLLARLRERSGIAATLVATQPVAGLADARAETLFHVVEEALRNIERHANARAVTLTLGPAAAAPGRLRLEIVDDGVGFDPQASRPGHFGLQGIREQAALMRAALSIDSQAGRGTRIALEFDA